MQERIREFLVEKYGYSRPEPDVDYATELVSLVEDWQGRKGMFKKGDEVRLALSIMGIVTETREIVLRVDKRGVWLDNGPGNDPSGPYDPVTGLWEDNYVIPMSRSIIIPVVMEEV